MTPLSSVNELSFADFAEAVRPLFEAAPPLASALYSARPFTSYGELIDTAESLAFDMPLDDRVSVLSAHPRIGADPSTVSTASFREQGYTHEAGMDPAQLASVYSELAELNARYEQRFGFRFVVFVNGRPKAEILEVLRERIRRSPEEELDTGLHDMFRIARARLASA